MAKDEKFIENFIREAEDSLKELHEKMVILEGSPNDMETVNGIFRILHTLKGNAAIFSLDSLKVISHSLEDLLAGRRGAARHIDVDRSFFDLLWEGINQINSNLKMIKNQNLPDKLTSPEEDLLSKINEKVTYYKIIQQLSESKYRADDRMRFFYNEIDVSRPVFIIQAFFEKVRLEPCTSQMIDNFVSAANQLSEVFKQNSEEKLAGIGQKMSSDLQTLVDDSSTVSNFLLGLLESGFKEICGGLRQVEIKIKPLDETKDAGKAPEFKMTFRVEEERIEEILTAVKKLNTIEDAFGRVRNGLAKAGVAPALILDFQKTLNDLNFVSRDIMRMLVKIKVTSPAMLFEKLEKLVVSLAAPLNKKARLVTEGKDVFVDRGKIEVLERILLHIVRNCLDHGLGTPEERLKSNKPEEGLISISVSEDNKSLVIVVSDDGRGIDFKSLRENALKTGKISQEEFDKLDDTNSDKLLFISGLTSRDAVSDISGRGVGMDVVLNTLEEVRGTIKITSVLGKGTTFTIVLPPSNSYGVASAAN